MMAALVGAFTPKTASVAEVQFQVVIFFRGTYSKDLYRSPIEPFVVVYSGGLLPTLHSCLVLLLGRLV